MVTGQFVLVPADDEGRSFSDSLLPDPMIEAGEAVLDGITEDGRNYVSGETVDWDNGMVAVAVYRAMIAAASPPPVDHCGWVDADEGDFTPKPVEYSDGTLSREIEASPAGNAEGLLPCPFCASENLEAAGCDGREWQVCRSCGCDGPVASGEQERIGIWNTRAALSEPRNTTQPLTSEAGGRLMQDKEVLREALLKWPCASCGGSGQYFNKRHGPEGYLEETITCKVCRGDGLHVIARAALAAVDQKGEG